MVVVSNLTENLKDADDLLLSANNFKVTVFHNQHTLQQNQHTITTQSRHAGNTSSNTTTEPTDHNGVKPHTDTTWSGELCSMIDCRIFSHELVVVHKFVNELSLISKNE